MSQQTNSGQERINRFLDTLREVLKEECPEHTTSVSIFFNANETRFTVRTKSLDQILSTKKGITNLKGEQIG